MSTSAPAQPGATQAGGRRPRRRWWLNALIAALIVTALGAGGVLTWMGISQSCGKAADSTQIGAVTEYCQSVSYHPNSAAMIAGPDGNLWYTDSRNKIARFTLKSGAITEFAAPTSPSVVRHAGLVRGADGNLWYIANTKLGRISMSGEFKEFDLPGELGRARGIAAGPGGTLWVTMTRGDSHQNPTLLNITIPTTATEAPRITKTPLPANAIRGPMVVGPDGALWMVTNDTVISRITPAGGVTQFPLTIPGPAPTGCGASCKAVYALTVGPDGNLWFVDGWSHIGRMTLAGSAAFFHVNDVGRDTSLGAGPDGNLWFSTDVGGIGRIAPDGAVIEFSLPHMDGAVNNITAGPDGGVWFTLDYSQPFSPSPRIVRITP